MRFNPRKIDVANLEELEDSWFGMTLVSLKCLDLIDESKTNVALPIDRDAVP